MGSKILIIDTSLLSPYFFRCFGRRARSEFGLKGSWAQQKKTQAELVPNNYGDRMSPQDLQKGAVEPWTLNILNPGSLNGHGAMTNTPCFGCPDFSTYPKSSWDPWSMVVPWNPPCLERRRSFRWDLEYRDSPWVEVGSRLNGVRKMASEKGVKRSWLPALVTWD